MKHASSSAFACQRFDWRRQTGSSEGCVYTFRASNNVGQRKGFSSSSAMQCTNKDRHKGCSTPVWSRTVSQTNWTSESLAVSRIKVASDLKHASLWSKQKKNVERNLVGRKLQKSHHLQTVSGQRSGRDLCLQISKIKWVQPANFTLWPLRKEQEREAVRFCFITNSSQIKCDFVGLVNIIVCLNHTASFSCLLFYVQSVPKWFHGSNSMETGLLYGYMRRCVRCGGVVLVWQFRCKCTGIYHVCCGCRVANAIVRWGPFVLWT